MPVPPSKKLQEINAARKLYEKFSGHEAVELGYVTVDVPDTLIVIGHIDGLLYSTTRDNNLEQYIHEFKQNARPLFCVAPDGSQIILLGGAYNFTERGIVDKPS